MTIQLGVPGAAGGGGGGAATSIAQSNGAVRVEADGSVTIEPAPAIDGAVLLKGVANGSAPLLRWDDDFGAEDAWFGVEKVNGAHLTNWNAGQFGLSASTVLYIGITGELETFDITNSGLEFKGPRWLHTQVNSSAWGQAFASLERQFEFAGIFPGTGAGEPTKFKISGRVDGEAGDTDGQFGLDVGVDFVTQVATETIDKIAGIIARAPAITDNLTGVITDAAALLVEGPASGAANNYAILVELGLTRLQQLMLSDVGPHAFGKTFLQDTKQFAFGGAYTGAGSDLSKIEMENSLTGIAGTQRYRGFLAGVSFITQANTDTIFNMSAIDVPVPPITDNLTGGVGIVQAATVRIQGAPTAGNTNFALIVEAGLTELNNLEHAGTLLGFYSTAGVAQPTVTGSRAGNAALADLLTELATMGLIVDSSSA